MPLLPPPLPSPPRTNSYPSSTNRAHIEPLWHAWISYAVDTPPLEDPIKAASEKPWSPKGHVPNYTFTRGAFKTFNTFVLLPTPPSHLLPSAWFGAGG
jgi:NADH:ubiquinone oxidoreductase subunit